MFTVFIMYTTWYYSNKCVEPINTHMLKACTLTFFTYKYVTLEEFED